LGDGIVIQKKINIVPYLFILPATLLIFLFKVYPIFISFVESFKNNGKWSMEVYKRVFGDLSFWNSLWVTIKLNLVLIPIQVTIGFIVAMLVNAAVKGVGIFRTIFYLPVTISLTTATLLWNLMFNPNSGIINSLIGTMNIPPQGFLIDKNQALWCIVVIAIWKGVGYLMMFFLAGLKNIDNGIYESAKIDGSDWITTLIRITFPLIRRVILFVLVLDTMANILLFVPMQIITQGGPEGSTNVLMMEAYRSIFRFNDRSRGAVIFTVLIFIIAVICVVLFRMLNEKDDK
jgi:multiple sugar transport system permease protein